MNRVCAVCLVISLLLIIPHWPVHAQLNDQRPADRPATEITKDKQLFFGINTLSAIRNTEYFGPIIQGHTLLSHQIHPYLRFYPAEHLRVDLGVFTRRDWADIRFFSGAEPTLSFKYQHRGFLLLLGNMEAGNQHRLIAPLYNEAWMLLRAPVPGLQLQYTQGLTFVDVWLAWLTLLRQQDSIPEELAAGISFAQGLIQSQQFNLELPIQGMLYHLGGQGIPTKDYSLFSGAIGIKLGMQVNGYKLLKGLCLESYYVASRYIKEVARPFRYGQGFYGSLTCKTAWVAIVGSYWYGHGFSTENIGSPLYQSMTILNKQVKYQAKVRELFLLRLLYEYQLADGVTLGLHLDPYYDFGNNLLEHAEGLYISYRPCFKLTKSKLLD